MWKRSIWVCKLSYQTYFVHFLHTWDCLSDNMRPGYDPLKEVCICWGPPSDLINIDWLGYLLSVYCLYETIQLSGKHFLAKRINPKISGTRKWNKYPSISLDSQCHLIEFSLWGLQSDIEKIKVFQESWSGKKFRPKHHFRYLQNLLPKICQNKRQTFKTTYFPLSDG